jgi:hypothetical protein
MNGKEFFKDSESVWVDIFKELCQRVGLTLDTLEFKPEPSPRRGWVFPYDEYEWTWDEQEKFIKWLINYGLKNRRALGMSYIKTKKMMKDKFVGEFMLLYGWRCKKEESEDV